MGPDEVRFWKLPQWAKRLGRAAVPVALVCIALPAWPGVQTAPARPRPGAERPITLAEGRAILAAWSEAGEFRAPSDLAADLAGLASGHAGARLAASASLARAGIELAMLESGGLADPERLDRNWDVAGARAGRAAFERPRARGELTAFMAGLPRREGTYLALLAQERRYAAMEKKGGWEKLDPEGRLALGDEGSAVLALRARLAAEGYLDPAKAASPDFDVELSEALADFEAHHGLSPDGELSPAVLSSLNVSAAERLSAIRANLERDRWLPARLPADRIEVDVPAARLTLFEDGRAVLVLPAAVGEGAHPTPLLVSEVRGVEFNPPWFVPVDIAREEILPLVRADPGWMATHGFFSDHGRLIQRRGQQNALGQVKFDMPDPEDILIHGMPSDEKSAFFEEARTLSHGCVRLVDPSRLASALLAPEGWAPEEVAHAIEAGRTRQVALKTPVPVFLVYRTVVLGEDGQPIFRPDPYHWDAKLAAILSAPVAKAPRPPPGARRSPLAPRRRRERRSPWPNRRAQPSG
ncbi:MAG: L,D-transpeptidase family protein [Caulobacteraceae bacterium]